MEIADSETGTSHIRRVIPVTTFGRTHGPLVSDRYRDLWNLHAMQDRELPPLWPNGTEWVVLDSGEPRIVPGGISPFRPATGEMERHYQLATEYPHMFVTDTTNTLHLRLLTQFAATVRSRKTALHNRKVTAAEIPIETSSTSAGNSPEITRSVSLGVKAFYLPAESHGAARTTIRRSSILGTDRHKDVVRPGVRGCL